jgi:hypothetical protein
MERTISQLEQIVLTYTPLLNNLEEQEVMYKSSPEKWSKKELIGHLIDSAQNNIRRMVVAQYEEKPHIIYAQDTWVQAAGYQNYPLFELIKIWELLNKHMIRVLKNIPASMHEREVSTGSLHSIQWLAADYNKHLFHHLHQVLELEPVAYT